MTKNNQKFKKSFQALASTTLKITIAGVIIGYFHQHDFWVAVLLAGYFLVLVYKNYFKSNSKNTILLIGMFLTGIFGIAGENWGVHNGYWTYHDLTDNRQLPYWLPFAWMLAFRTIYKLELNLINTLQLKSLTHKTWLAVLIAAFFPAYGEVITIYLGVWTYSWPYQIFGVPLYAIICLVVLHMGVNFLLSIYAKKRKINDVVFTSEE